ncbi:MAG TPA: hypothetical protein VH437_09495 [Terriglobales bacterium]|jgi:uncharacterized protein (TIGR02246 family)
MSLVLFRSVFSSLAICLILVRNSYPQNDTPLSAEDSVAVWAVLERYRTTWLANGQNGVLSTFAKNAILMPAHGGSPVKGLTEIKKYWWPRSTTKTTITRFVQKFDEVSGDEKLAYARGTSDVEWRSENGGTQNWQNDSSFLFLLKRQADGTWRISHLIWDAGENKRLK